MVYQPQYCSVQLTQFSKRVLVEQGAARLKVLTGPLLKDLPVSVELDGKVSHDTHGFVGEGHLHLDDASTPGKRAGDLQALGFHGWEPNLQNETSERVSSPLAALLHYSSCPFHG